MVLINLGKLLQSEKRFWLINFRLKAIIMIKRKFPSCDKVN